MPRLSKIVTCRFCQVFQQVMCSYAACLTTPSHQHQWPPYMACAIQHLLAWAIALRMLKPQRELKLQCVLCVLHVSQRSCHSQLQRYADSMPRDFPKNPLPVLCAVLKLQKPDALVHSGSQICSGTLQLSRPLRDAGDTMHTNTSVLPLSDSVAILTLLCCCCCCC